ncbi:MAG: hypothetical protein QOH28_2252, partial [Actinomycetota bacterium]|nr:hypothetical protein [Actinomycetota bacterium]
MSSSPRDARVARVRRRWVLPAVVVAAAVASGGLATWWTTARGSNATQLPADWVVQENRRPGTSAWRIAKGSYGGVEGYASRVSARVGDSITLYVSTSAPAFRVEAYRMGWYQGLGGRLVWRSPEMPATAQPAPTIAAPTRTVTAVWEPSMRVHVSKD